MADRPMRKTRQCIVPEAMKRKRVRRRMSMAALGAWLTGLASSVLMGACGMRQIEDPRAPIEARPAASSASPATSVPMPGPVPAMVPVSSALTLDAYKQEVARRIYLSSAKDLYDGAPPPMLKSVVVLSVSIDSNGQPRRVSVLRSNGHGALNQLAMQSVEGAAPLPRPGRALLRSGVAEFTETWLFRDDGRFQIRSLALAQASADD